MNDKTESKNVLGTTEFKSAGDWINQVLDENCSSVEGAVAAVAEVKDKDGKVTTKGVRAKQGKKVTNLDALKALAKENNIQHKDAYPNPGMWRMNIGNMLRTAARKRHGLTIKGKWTPAPKGFPVNDEKTHKPDGSPIKEAKAKKDAA